MERLRTRLWPGGLTEIMTNDANHGDALKRALETEVEEPADELARSLPVIAGARRQVAAFEITRIMNEQELSELRQVQRAHSAPPPEPAPALRSEHAPADPELRKMAEHLGLSAQRRKRLAIGTALVLLAVGGWCAQRASATGKPHVPALPPMAQEVITRPMRVVPQVPAPAPVAPRAPRLLAPRAAVDALAAGEDVRAAELYRELAALASDSRMYIEAAQILEERRSPGRR